MTLSTITKRGFFEILKYLKIIQHRGMLYLHTSYLSMKSDCSHGKKGKMKWERKQVKESAADNSWAGCVLIVTD